MTLQSARPPCALSTHSGSTGLILKTYQVFRSQIIGLKDMSSGHFNSRSRGCAPPSVSMWPASPLAHAGLSADSMSARLTHRARGRSPEGRLPLAARPHAGAGPAQAAPGQARLASREGATPGPAPGPLGTSNPKAAAECPSSQGLCRASIVSTKTPFL